MPAHAGITTSRIEAPGTKPPEDPVDLLDPEAIRDLAQLDGGDGPCGRGRGPGVRGAIRASTGSVPAAGSVKGASTSLAFRTATGPPGPDGATSLQRKLVRSWAIRPVYSVGGET